MSKVKFLVLGVLFLISCSIKKYYFSINDFIEPKVYQYKCELDSSNTEYWKLTSNISDSTLITEAFDDKFHQYEFFKEKITNKGSEVIEFNSYAYDTKGNKIILERTINEVDVFLWNSKENYKYSAKHLEEEVGLVQFEKKREYIGKEYIDLFGEKIKVLKFKGEYKSEVIGRDDKYEYYKYSYYAKGFGLVKMETFFPNGNKRTLILSKIYSMKEWNNLISK